MLGLKQLKSLNIVDSLQRIPTLAVGLGSLATGTKDKARIKSWKCCWTGYEIVLLPTLTLPEIIA